MKTWIALSGVAVAAALLSVAAVLCSSHGEKSAVTAEFPVVDPTLYVDHAAERRVQLALAEIDSTMRYLRDREDDAKRGLVHCVKKIEVLPLPAMTSRAKVDYRAARAAEIERFMQRYAKGFR